MARKITSVKAQSKFKGRMFLTLGLRRKPLKLFCDHCGKFIASDMPWQCGFCDTENRRTKLYSFLYKCQKCKKPPKALECPHCKQFIYFDKTQEGRHPARILIPPVSPETREQRLARLAHEREERKEALQHDIYVARLNSELAALQSALESTKAKSTQEELEKSLLEHQARTIGVYQIQKREEQMIKTTLADDPDLQEMATLGLKAWVRMKSPPGT